LIVCEVIMGKKLPFKNELEGAIANATRSAVSSLFRDHPGEHFYYCALITTGEALSPNLTAWSVEALDEAVRNTGEKDDHQVRVELKWSYADSPYYCYGEQYFDEVKDSFDAIDSLVRANAESWEAAYELKMSVMVAAMKLLDGEGLFGKGKRRDEIVINVECMPPDYTNVERARQLNPPRALVDWINEAAEV
jgi:hypothetical protein